jgi:hypothetical protein
MKLSDGADIQTELESTLFNHSAGMGRQIENQLAGDYPPSQSRSG